MRVRLTASLDAFRFDEAAGQLYQFVWGTFCDWYIEFTKPLLQGADAQARAETQATTAWVLAQVLHLLHPIMPFVSEGLWQNLAGENAGLLISAPWPELVPDAADRAAVSEMEALIQELSATRAVRAELNIPPGLGLEAEVRDADPAAAARIERQKEYFRRLARVTLTGVEATSAVGSFGATAPGGITGVEAKSAAGSFVAAGSFGAVQVVGAGATFVLKVGAVDLAREKARLEKEIGRLDAELARIAAKLGNPQFVSKAKPEIVENQRERAADATRSRDRLRAAYDRLAAV